ncbi:MAG: hypothetical protein ACOYYS_14510 [Chloroflexota bacterium]
MNHPSSSSLLLSKAIPGFIHFKTDYTPKRFNGKTHSLSPKTLRNIWVGLSSFYTWASKELHIANPMKDVPSPKYQKPPIEPFTQDEVQSYTTIDNENAPSRARFCAKTA